MILWCILFHEFYVHFHKSLIPWRKCWAFWCYFSKYRVSTDYWLAVIPSGIPKNTNSDRYNGQNTEYWPTWKKGGNSRMIYIYCFSDTKGTPSKWCPLGKQYIKTLAGYKVFIYLKGTSSLQASNILRITSDLKCFLYQSKSSICENDTECQIIWRLITLNKVI